jgi:hypothetical protein
MKKNSMDYSATLWMKDPNNENGHHTNAVELEAKAVFGRLEEPLIVAPYSEARRGISHVERRPVGDLSEEASDQFSGGTLWKSCTHDVVAWMSISALSWRV